MEADEFAKILDEKGIKLSLSSGNDTFNINLLTTTNELNSALSVLDDVETSLCFQIMKSKR